MNRILKSVVASLVLGGLVLALPAEQANAGWGISYSSGYGGYSGYGGCATNYNSFSYGGYNPGYVPNYSFYYGTPNLVPPTVGYYPVTPNFTYQTFRPYHHHHHRHCH